MTTLSLLVNVISIAVAAVMAAIVVRMRRDERARSDARAAALAEMARADFLPEPELFASEPDASVETPAPVFSAPDRDATRTTRLIAVCAVAVVLLLMAMVAAFRSSTRNSEPASVASTATAAAPLELVALRHEQASGQLTVSGRVQNPRSAQPVADLTATVFLFGRDGAFMTSGRAPLDVATLEPGGDSAFTVSIPVNGTVLRYRVSFRDSSGHAVGHVDRRAGVALARNE
jgi:hypothetical protein